ncbi:hypothetical protein EON65_40520, partial [archaeon]
MLSKAQWVLVISLVGWGLVVYKLMAIRSNNKHIEELAIKKREKEGTAPSIHPVVTNTPAVSSPNNVLNEDLQSKGHETKEMDATT